jgi:rare lipoprotein A
LANPQIQYDFRHHFSDEVFSLREPQWPNCSNCGNQRAMKNFVALLSLVFSHLAFGKQPLAHINKVSLGMASFYAATFQGRMTASGELFDQEKLTAAHRTFPFGTMVEVKNLKNGRTVKVKVNDRGPFVKGRILDVSSRAAKRLGFYRKGVARISVKRSSL